MAKAPILVIDDDEDDLELIKVAAENLKLDRPVLFLNNGNELEEYLHISIESPFLIISDVNLPGETGFDIKKRIANNAKLKYKTVPFIFWSNGASEKQIQQAYDLPAQGFFIKPNTLNELIEAFDIILKYWSKSLHPKRVE